MTKLIVPTEAVYVAEVLRLMQHLTGGDGNSLRVWHPEAYKTFASDSVDRGPVVEWERHLFSGKSLEIGDLLQVASQAAAK